MMNTSFDVLAGRGQTPRPVEASLPAGTPASSGDAAHTVHVIVLNWNGEDDTRACLDSLLAQRGVRLEVLLVDNDSPDGSGARLRARYPDVGYLQTGANLGYAGGNNRGLDWARARRAAWVLVVNNDTVADPDCVRRMLDAAMSDSRIAAVAPLIVRHDDPERVWFAGGRHDRLRALGVHRHFAQRVDEVLRVEGAAELHACSFLTGCCLLIRCAALDEVGQFQADFFAYAEDLELSMRLTQAGWRLAWVPDARLAHRVPRLGAPGRPDQIRLRDRNRRRIVRAHYSWPWRIAFACWFWPTRLMLLAGYCARGDLPRARAILAGLRER
jgi:GT2 family glycosyltransferase